MIDQILALLKVIFIDISLSGDNAIIIGMAAAGLAAHQRKKAIFFGIMAAVVLRILFSSGAVYLLGFKALGFVGGLLLLWVCWKMFQEITGNEDDVDEIKPKKTLMQAVMQIVIADVSMSLDNVLAVACASRDHIYIMMFGLLLSISFMAVAANFISNILAKWKWLNYVGLVLVFWVAAEMIVKNYQAALEVIK